MMKLILAMLLSLTVNSEAARKYLIDAVVEVDANGVPSLNLSSAGGYIGVSPVAWPNAYLGVSQVSAATYSAAITGLAVAAAATDFWTITGSASKTVRLKRIQFSGVATAAAAVSFQLIKRSTADTGGTSTAPTVTSFDSNNAAGTATVNAYTVTPTGIGTLVGIIKALRATMTTAAGAIPQVPVIINFSDNDEQGLVLRGTAQQLALNLNGATVAGLTLDIDVTWTEE